jgi:two-component system, NtrC family, sensor kinase
VTRRRSLRVELVVTLAIVLTMAAVSLVLATELLAGRRHLEQQRTRIEEHARGLAVIVAPRLSEARGGAAHAAGIEPVLRGSLGTLGITTLEILRARPSAPPEVLVTIGLPVVATPERAVAPAGRRTFEGPEGELVVEEPVRTFAAGSGPTVGFVLRVHAQPLPWTRAGDFSDIAVIALGIGGISLLLGIALVDAQVVKPLRSLHHAVERVGAGDLRAQVPADGPAELRRLADAFNRMTASLAQGREQNEAQRRELARSEQLATVGRIAAGTAHEIGNPLAAILGYVDLLLDPRNDPPLPESQRVLLERAQVQLQRIQGTIGQLVDYSRRQPAATRAVRVGEAVPRLLSLLRHDARCRDVEFAVTDEAAQVAASADPLCLDQIVQNLVVNAARAARTAAHPRVHVDVTADDEAVVLTVRDNGPGIEPEVRARLFEPFFTTAEAGEGTGLGLATSLALAEEMGATLVEFAPTAPLVAGEPVGAGFRLRLPRAPAPPRPNVPDDSSV